MAKIKVRVVAPIGSTKEKLDGVKIELLDEELVSIASQFTGGNGAGSPAIFDVSATGEYVVRIHEQSLKELLLNFDGQLPDPTFGNSQTRITTPFAPRADFTQISVEDASNSVNYPVRLKLVGAAQSNFTQDELAQFVAEVMTAAAQSIVANVAKAQTSTAKTEALQKARKALDNLFCGNQPLTSILPAPPLNSTQLELADDTVVSVPQADPEDESEASIHVLVACATCYQFYNTPNTAYYKNYTWLQGCLYNPPCS